MSSKEHRPAIQARLRGRRDGFTIFEVIMATMVMAFGIATSLTVIQYGIRALDNARNTTIAGQILQSVMEDIRMLPWTITSGTGTSISTLETTNNNASGNVALDASFTNGLSDATAMVNRFTITRNITDVNANMKNIQLTASWTGIDGRSHSLMYQSYYGKNGLHDYFFR